MEAWHELAIEIGTILKEKGETVAVAETVAEVANEMPGHNRENNQEKMSSAIECSDPVRQDLNGIAGPNPEKTSTAIEPSGQMQSTAVRVRRLVASCKISSATAIARPPVTEQATGRLVPSGSRHSRTEDRNGSRKSVAGHSKQKRINRPINSTTN